MSHKGAKREQILVTASRCFLEQGFAATSMDDIAAATPVSKATLYKYFKDKNDLFASTIKSHCQTLCDKINQSFMEGLPLTKGLKNIAELFWDLHNAPESVKIYRLIIAEQRHFPKISQIFYNSGPRQVKVMLANYLERVAVDQGLNIPDYYQAAIDFLNLLKSETHMLAMFNIPCKVTTRTKEQIINHSIQLFIKGYRS